MAATTSPRTDVVTWADAAFFGAGWPVALARIAIGVLWYQQLLWKLPWERFGCPASFALSTDLRTRTSGLCDWIGLEIRYPLFPPYAEFLKAVVAPNLPWMGYLIWLLEAAIAVSLLLGLLTRLGALLGTLQAANLYVGLVKIPIEWEWTYGMLIIVNGLLLYLAAGRRLGLDALIRPRLLALAPRHAWAKWLALTT